MENEPKTSINEFSIGTYRVFPSRNLVVDEFGKQTPITPKMLAVLIELAKNQGTTLSKAYLFEAVWGTVHTSDMVLSRAISDLRKVFGDSAKQQLYVETISKQGYSLKQPVTWHNQASNTADINQVPEVNKTHQSIYWWPYIALLIILAVIVSAYLTIDNAEKQTEVTDFSHVQLTANNDLESFVRFSPDGKHIAYSNKNRQQPFVAIKLMSLIDNNIQLISKRESTNNDKQYYDSSPAFSPNETKIAYRHHQNNRCVIRISDWFNATHQDLVGCTSSTINALDWSPNGQHLVTTIFNHIDKTESLALINTVTGETTTLKSPEKNASGYLWPRFSPDGQSIAVVYYQPNDHLWTIGTVNSVSGEFSEITSLGEEVSQVVWNRSGNVIYYLLVNSQNDGIWQVDIATKQRRLIKQAAGRSLDYDEINNQFSFIKKEQKLSVWKITKETDKTVTSSSISNDLARTYYPELSHDEKWLAFVSNSGDRDSLWIRDLSNDKSYLILQAQMSQRLLDPHWSPLDNKIMISTVTSESSQIIEIDLKLGNSKAILPDRQVKFGQWSADGKIRYWYEKRKDGWQVVKQDIESEQEETILSHEISRFIIHRNTIYFQKIGSYNVHKKNIGQGGEETVILSSYQYFDWDIKGSTLYYLSPTKGTATQMLNQLDLESKLVTPLFTVENQMPSSYIAQDLTVSKDGKSAYYTRGEKYLTDIVLVTPRH